MKRTTLHLGLDVHRESIMIAIAESGPKGEVRLHGEISHDLHALEKVIAKLRQAHPGAVIEACYEAGPCGFGVARRRAQLKISPRSPLFPSNGISLQG